MTKTVGDYIHERRKEMCMTQVQLAAAVGCRQKDVSRWETGVREPGIYTLKKIAQALGCLVDDLL